MCASCQLSRRDAPGLEQLHDLTGRPGVDVRGGAFTDLLPQGSLHRPSSVAGSKQPAAGKDKPIDSFVGFAQAQKVAAVSSRRLTCDATARHHQASHLTNFPSSRAEPPKGGVVEDLFSWTHRQKQVPPLRLAMLGSGRDDGPWSQHALEGPVRPLHQQRGPFMTPRGTLGAFLVGMTGLWSEHAHRRSRA